MVLSRQHPVPTEVGTGVWRSPERRRDTIRETDEESHRRSGRLKGGRTHSRGTVLHTLPRPDSTDCEFSPTLTRTRGGVKREINLVSRGVEGQMSRLTLRRKYGER